MTPSGKNIPHLKSFVFRVNNPIVDNHPTKTISFVFRVNKPIVNNHPTKTISFVFRVN